MWKEKIRSWAGSISEHQTRRQIVLGCLGCALIFGAFAGAAQILPRQETIVLDPESLLTVDGAAAAEPAEPPFKVDAKAAVLMDASTGTILFQQDAHEKLPPASVTKVMTMLLVMEAVKEGVISLEDQVTISEHAASMGGSQMYMEPGEIHTVAELMEGVAMASANDGCVSFKKKQFQEKSKISFSAPKIKC